jgi:hypothetical protein
VTWDGTELVLDISHYDSVLRAKPNASGDQWDGTWRKRTKADKWIEMPFHAKPGKHPRFVYLGYFSEEFKVLDGKWSVKFASEEDKARRPLAAAEVQLEEVEGNPGYYTSKFFLRPHYQLEGLTVSLRLVSKLPSAKGGG